MGRLFSRWLPCATLFAWGAIMLHYSELPGRAIISFLGSWYSNPKDAAHLDQWYAQSFLHTLDQGFHALSPALFTTRVDSFLIPGFRVWVLAAGIAMALMALVFAVFPANAACCTASDCSHPLSRFAVGKWLTFLVLIIPFTAAAVFSPEGYGESTMLNRGVSTDASGLPGQGKISKAPLDLPLPSNNPFPTPTAATPAAKTAANAPAAAGQQQPPNDYIERTPEGYLVAEVLDLLYAAQDTNLRKDFEGKTVQLIGQLMPDTSHNAKGARFKAVRMFMTCCAADARPVATLVEADKLPDVPEMSWIKIVGTATFPIENGRHVSILKADKVEKCDPPSETMLY